MYELIAIVSFIFPFGFSLGYFYSGYRFLNSDMKYNIEVTKEEVFNISARLEKLLTK